MSSLIRLLKIDKDAEAYVHYTIDQASQRYPKSLAVFTKIKPESKHRYTVLYSPTRSCWSTDNGGRLCIRGWRIRVEPLVSGGIVYLVPAEITSDGHILSKSHRLPGVIHCPLIDLSNILYNLFSCVLEETSSEQW
jgi:hypothetical protein